MLVAIASDIQSITAAVSANFVVTAENGVAAGGVRAAPGAEELRSFVEALAPLDGLEVGRLLAAKMVRHAVQLHALALETCNVLHIVPYLPIDIQQEHNVSGPRKRGLHKDAVSFHSPGGALLAGVPACAVRT